MAIFGAVVEIGKQKWMPSPEDDPGLHVKMSYAYGMGVGRFIGSWLLALLSFVVLSARSRCQFQDDTDSGPRPRAVVNTPTAPPA